MCEDRNHMKVRTLEIRDRATFIPAMAVRLEGRKGMEKRLLKRAGYGSHPYVLLTKIDGGDNLETQCDPYQWRGSRTMQWAHLWVLDNLDKVFPPGMMLRTPLFIDVEFILGETATPKTSEL